jgi:hypothetical protein
MDHGNKGAESPGHYSFLWVIQADYCLCQLSYLIGWSVYSHKMIYSNGSCALFLSFRRIPGSVAGRLRNV